LKHVEGVEFVPERGFRRTCEGLKLAVGIALDATEDGFRRTCEGLKPPLEPPELLPPPRFRRTCEGLKRRDRRE